MEKENKDTKRLLVVALIMLLITVGLFGGTYAFFTAVFTGVEEDTTITVTGGSLGIHMDGGNMINMQNIYPREEAWDTKRFTITGNNNTSLEMEYFLNLVVTENTFQSGSLTYTLVSLNTSNSGSPIPEIATQRAIPTGAGVHSLGGGFFDQPGNDMVHTYYLTFFFPSRGVPQNEDQGATFRAHVGITGEAPVITHRATFTTPRGEFENGEQQIFIQVEDGKTFNIPVITNVPSNYVHLGWTYCDTSNMAVLTNYTVTDAVCFQALFITF